MSILNISNLITQHIRQISQVRSERDMGKELYMCFNIYFSLYFASSFVFAFPLFQVQGAVKEVCL